MKSLRLISLSLIVLLSIITVSAKKSDYSIIVNGLFFKELPSDIKNSSITSEMNMFVIHTPNGARAVCIYVPSIVLSEEATQYAIPIENIPEGKELIRRFNEQKENSSGLDFTMGATEPLIKIGDRFPDFSAIDISGKRWNKADINGKVMVLNLWFTGCGPCRAEMPELSSWKDEMPDVMFFSSTYETPEVARQVLDRVNFNWIPLVNDTQFKKYIGGNGYPLTIVVDKDGKIAAFEYGTSPEQRNSLKNKISELR